MAWFTPKEAELGNSEYAAEMRYCVGPSCRVTVTLPVGVKSMLMFMNEVAIVFGINTESSSSKPFWNRMQTSLEPWSGRKKLILY